MSNELVKASFDALVESLLNVVPVIKKHESLSATIIDAAEAEIADIKLKAEVGALVVAGFSGVIAQLKAMGSDIPGDLDLIIQEVPLVQKLIAALSA